jgi:hypothetical protein
MGRGRVHLSLGDDVSSAEGEIRDAFEFMGSTGPQRWIDHRLDVDSALAIIGADVELASHIEKAGLLSAMAMTRRSFSVRTVYVADDFRSSTTHVDSGVAENWLVRIFETMHTGKFE